MKRFSCWMLVFLLVAGLFFFSPDTMNQSSAAKDPQSANESGITTAMIQAICNQYGYKDNTTYWVYNEKKDKAAHPKLPDDWYVGSTDSSYHTSYQIGSGKTLSYRCGGYYECAGFANFIGLKLTGVLPKTGSVSSSSGCGSGWTAYSVSQIKSMGGVRPGDIIRNGSHSAVIYSVSGSSFTVAECWGGRSNKIRIGGGFNGSAKTLDAISGIKYILRYGKPVSPELLPESPEISGATWPTSLSYGSSFGLRGNILCRYTMTSINATVTDTVSGERKFDVTVTPNSTSYSIGPEDINNKILFNKLPNNRYYRYTIRVTCNRSGSLYTTVVLDKEFKVGSPAATAAPTAVPTPTPRPGTPTPPPPVPIGTVLTIDSLRYEKTGSYTVSFNGLAKAGSMQVVQIPGTVSIFGTTYQVTKVGSRALYGDKTIRTLKLGKNIKTIGKEAFAKCSKLTTVKGATRVSTIGSSAFINCRMLKNLPALGRLQTIGASAFKGCVKLTSFTLSGRVKTIGKNAFYGCKALSRITIKSTRLTASSVKTGAFKGISSKAVFSCPSGKRSFYKSLIRKKGAPKTAQFK